MKFSPSSNLSVRNVAVDHATPFFLLSLLSSLSEKIVNPRAYARVRAIKAGIIRRARVQVTLSLAQTSNILKASTLLYGTIVGTGTSRRSSLSAE